MINLQKLSGISSVAAAAIYIGAFIYFGAVDTFPSQGTPSEKIAYLTEYKSVYSLIYFSIYLLFGVLLSILVVGLHERLATNGNKLILVASLFGYVWVALVMASGMIAMVGLDHVIRLSYESTEKAFEHWQIISLISTSIGGSNEMVGGLWVLLVSITGLQTKTFSFNLNALGSCVGALGIATLYPTEIFTILFGLSQIVWFVWIGSNLIRTSCTIRAC
jgi:hypothetical protein